MPEDICHLHKGKIPVQEIGVNVEGVYFQEITINKTIHRSEEALEILTPGMKLWYTNKLGTPNLTPPARRDVYAYITLKYAYI